MIKTYRQIQRERRARLHQREADRLLDRANRQSVGPSLPPPAPLPLLQQPGYRELAHNPWFLLAFIAGLAVLVLDLDDGQLGLKALMALAQWIGGEA